MKNRRSKKPLYNKRVKTLEEMMEDMDLGKERSEVQQTFDRVLNRKMPPEPQESSVYVGSALSTVSSQPSTDNDSPTFVRSNLYLKIKEDLE